MPIAPATCRVWKPATDVDHNGFAAAGFPPYDLDFIQNSEWEDYTRQLSNNVTYAVYARMAGFAGGGHDGF